GYNVDGGLASAVTLGAVGAERWEVAIRGRAAHAGVHPEEGISATVVASLALADVYRGGGFGKVGKNGSQGTPNVGSCGDAAGGRAGVATNVVTDYVLIRGEARSHDTQFVRQIVTAYRDAFRRAAGELRNVKGKQAKVRFQTRRDYYPFRIREDAPVVRH